MNEGFSEEGHFWHFLYHSFSQSRLDGKLKKEGKFKFSVGKNSGFFLFHPSKTGSESGRSFFFLPTSFYFAA